MNNYTIKGVVKKIYSIDYNNIKLENNTELIISKKANDFHQLLYMGNEITNTYLIPYFESGLGSTQTGIFYKDKSIYNHPLYGEPFASFRLSLTGIKQNTYYRLRFICTGIESNVDLVSSKLYIVLNGKDIIHNKEIPFRETIIDYIYPSDATALDIAVTIGKVSISDIVIEEVEVTEPVSISKPTVEIPDLMNLKAYAVFNPSMLINKDKTISKFPLLRGIGLNVLYNRDKDIILIERNKENDVIQENIGLSKFLIDVKCINNGYVTNLTVSEDISPFNSSNGYASFKLSRQTETTKIYILIYELL